MSSSMNKKYQKNINTWKYKLLLISITYAYVHSLCWFVETFVDVCSAPNNQLSVSKNNRFTLIKQKIKFASYIRKVRRKRLQSHIWLTASSNMNKYLHISSYIRKPFLVYDFATAPVWISLHMRKIYFSFLSVHNIFTEGMLTFTRLNHRGIHKKRPTSVFFLGPTKPPIIWIGKPAPARQC